MPPVYLAPRPGFCIKSTTLPPGIIYPGNQSTPNLLESTAPIPIPPNRKVFVNIAWDANVPPPPEGSEDAIQKAMLGEDQIDSNPNGWYVPVIVSNPREDSDKVGNPSVVFDCVFNTSVKSRTLRDPEFKVFLIELSLQRIEAQTGLSFSRSISTPNIPSKGKLLPRTVHIPASMLSALSKSDGAPEKVNSPSELSPISTKNSFKTPLIQELSSESQPSDKPKSKNTLTSDSLPGLRGILKSSIATSADVAKTNPVNGDEPLYWTWSIVDNGTSSNSKSISNRIKFQVHITDLTVPMIASSSLHISLRALELTIPGRRPLILDLSISDAEIAARTGVSYSSILSASDAEVHKWKIRQQEETTAVLQLKRQRDFDVDGAEAEWKIGSGIVEICILPGITTAESSIIRWD